MREIKSIHIEDKIRELLLEASYVIGADIQNAIDRALQNEPSPAGKAVLGQIAENNQIAASERVAICQDTGMAVIFIDVGQDIAIVGGALNDAINNGVRRAYAEGYLRKSVVSDPLYDRINTKDNTPAIIHTRIVPGDKIDILVTPKGFGSENMSAIKMLVPADGEAGVRSFIIETVEKAGPNPCPPVIVGVGIGGTMEMAAIMAKRMTARPIDQRNADPRYAALEQSVLNNINKLGIGPGGVGGRTTALAVNIDYYPTHIASMPVAINICCHAARHAHGVL